jgi:hypothetical protein
MSMDKPSFVPEQVRQFAPKPKPQLKPRPREGEPPGELMAMLQRAAGKAEQEHARATMLPTQPVSEQVPRFVPTGEPPENDPVDKAGRALLAMLGKAAGVSNEEYERATILAGRLASELRTSENRIKELEAEVTHFRDRAARAEEWLRRIAGEIESQLMGPRDSSRLPGPGN